MSVEAVFSRTATTYDSARAKLIPCFEQLYTGAVQLIPQGADHILDLGAGTGLLSAFMRERFPDVRLHLIDTSQPMLDRASERFARDGEVFCQHGDYTTARWGASYDAIVSALSIHHLEDAAKRALFTRIYSALKPGGMFLNAEQVLATSPALEAKAKLEWLAQVRKRGATEQQINDSVLRQTEDRCATIEDQIAWLWKAGFHKVSCAFQSGRFALFSARRF